MQEDVIDISSDTDEDGAYKAPRPVKPDFALLDYMKRFLYIVWYGELRGLFILLRMYCSLLVKRVIGGLEPPIPRIFKVTKKTTYLDWKDHNNVYQEMNMHLGNHIQVWDKNQTDWKLFLRTDNIPEKWANVPVILIRRLGLGQCADFSRWVTIVERGAGMPKAEARFVEEM